MEQARQLAEKLLSEHGKEAAAPADPTEAVGPPSSAPAEADGGSGLMGLASSAARSYFGQGEGAGRAGLSEGKQADPGVVDTLLTLYKSTTGQQFGGQEHEYDQLMRLARTVLGEQQASQLGRDVLKAWVRQRVGL